MPKLVDLCAFLDPNINEKGWSNPLIANPAHPGATWEIRWTGNLYSPGQQCTYDSKGKLITKGEGAGTPDLYGFFTTLSAIHPTNILHGTEDLLPWVWDKFVLKNPDFYWQFRRPPNNGNNCPENDGMKYPPEISKCCKVLNVIEDKYY